MTSITQLIANISHHIPFASEAAAQAYLNQYSLDDQAALISAAYIGRDHIHYDKIQPDYVPVDVRFDRFFTTGTPPQYQFVPPSGWASILYEKNTQLRTYHEAFVRCATGSGYSLAAF